MENRIEWHDFADVTKRLGAQRGEGKCDLRLKVP